ncbi:uncharacterized protein LOC112565593 isoform X2 [Pomacea canaliculata]|uniref:uncharacterized protein LOC112565593 isoform X2 n=1 Tax=Pomacea canaliculata TaxID=400727 RepID=UPI000D72C507|nr:uncharacterized protein LOC112565593 isoform X2 [Pomacea canaliculata]
MATSGGAGKEHIRLRAQLAPTKATENSQDHTVSERESQKRDPGDEGIIEEQLQNILPEVESSSSSHTLQRLFYQNRLGDELLSGEKVQGREALFKTPAAISLEEQKKGEVYQEYFPVSGNALIFPQFWNRVQKEVLIATLITD